MCAQHEPLLEVDDLWVTAFSSGHRRDLVSGASFAIGKGDDLGIVGESGSGKSTCALAILRLLAPNLAITRGAIRFQGTDLARARDSEIRAIRGRKIAMVLQDPLTSLNPVRRMGFQLCETRVIQKLPLGPGRRWATGMLESLGFREPAVALQAYPFAFSGGMRQRACIGIAFSGEPDLIIADEPTTALDVSLQGRVLRLLLEQRERFGTSLMLISHDITVIRSMCSRIMVMYGGRVLEKGSTKAVLEHSASPYTSGLISSLPTIGKFPRGQVLPTMGIEEANAGVEVRGGCPFAPRCPNVQPICATEFPPPTTVDAFEEHTVWCWNPVK